jgi:hypothetical protein
VLTPNWDADLVAIGVGAELPLWQRRAVEAGISSRIHFLGFRSDVPDLLRSAMSGRSYSLRGLWFGSA